MVLAQAVKMKRIAVDCTFSENGLVRVRRIRVADQWHNVEQGRQWLDANGRHLLVMFADGSVQEIVLRPDTLVWELLPRQTGITVV